MGSPVKVADELVEAAKETATLANRSIAKQIEHWARLGRAVEQLAKTTDVMAFKAQLADPQDAIKVVHARAALKRLVGALADRMYRDAARKLILETGKPCTKQFPVVGTSSLKYGRTAEGSLVVSSTGSSSPKNSEGRRLPVCGRCLTNSPR